MSTPAEQVAAQFSQAQGYVNTATTHAAGFTSALTSALFVAPTIDVTWSSGVTVPALPTLPAAPDAVVIEYTAPATMPGALAITAPDALTVDSFTENAPTLDFGTKPTPVHTTAPTLSFGAAPTLTSATAPTLAFDAAPTLVFPAAPIAAYGAAPDVSFDTAPMLDFGTAPTVSISAAPDLTLDAMPVLDFGTRPVLPTVDSVAFPADITLTMPTAPALLSLSTPTFAGVDLHESWLAKLEDIPTLTLVAPTPYSYALGPEYASSLLDSLKATLLVRLAGGSGLNPAVEAAIWDRARGRETSLALANEAEIMRANEALGFSLPTGVLAVQLTEARRNYYDKVSTLSRDQAIKAAEMEQENLKATIEAGMQLESKLIDNAYNMERLTFESAKNLAENAISIYNAQVEKYKAVLSAYATYEAAYKTLIEAEMSKVEVYKAELAAEQTKAQVNMTLVGQYKAEIDARMGYVQIYQAQISAANARMGLEQAKLGLAGEEIRAYVAGINGETAKLEAYKVGAQIKTIEADIYKSQLQAEMVKVELFKAGIEAQSATVAAYRAGIEARAATVEVHKTALQLDQIKVELYKAGIDAQATTIAAYRAGVEAQAATVEAYRGLLQADATKVELYKGIASVEGIKVDAFKAEVQSDATRAEVYKIGVDGEISKVTAYKAKADAFSSMVGARSEVSRSQIAYYSAMVQAKTAEWQGFTAQVDAEKTRIQALGMQATAQTEYYKVQTTVAETTASLAAQLYGVQIKEYEAIQNYTLQAAKVNGDFAIAASSAHLEAAKVGAQVFAQMIGSAYSTIHATAAISGQGSTSVHYNYSNATTSKQSNLGVA